MPRKVLWTPQYIVQKSEPSVMDYPNTKIKTTEPLKLSKNVKEGHLLCSVFSTFSVWGYEDSCKEKPFVTLLNVVKEVF